MFQSVNLKERMVHIPPGVTIKKVPNEEHPVANIPAKRLPPWMIRRKEAAELKKALKKALMNPENLSPKEFYKKRRKERAMRLQEKQTIENNR